jgi:hypothetical protein
LIKAVADVLGYFEEFLEVGDDSFAARHNSHPAALGRRTSISLLAHHRNRLWRRADERDVALLAHFRELRLFREKPIAWMDCIGIGYLCRAHDRRDVQVALLRGCGTDTGGIIGQPHRQRLAVCL